MSVAGNPVLDKKHDDDEQSDDDLDKTITLPRSVRSHVSNRTLQRPVVATEDVIDPLLTGRVYTISDAGTKSNESERPRRIAAKLKYRSTINSRKRRFKLRKVVLPFVSVIIFMLGTVGVLYSAGVHIGDSSVAVTPVSNVITPVASAVKTLAVQGDAIAGSQGYTNSAQQTAYIDTQMHIQLLSSVDGQTWQQTDLTRLTGAPVTNGSVLTSYSWTKGGRQQIAYIDAFGHVHLLSSGVDGHWQVLDVTQLAAAPLAGGKTLFGYDWQQTGSQQIVFVDRSQHIQELESVDGTSWHVTDVTNLTHTAPSNGTALAGFIWTRAGEEHLVYIDDLRHVVDLFTTPGGSWQSIDLSTTDKAPLANGNVIVGYEWRINGTAYIDYIDGSNHIQELSSSLQAKWTLSDLTAVTNGPVANGKALAGYDWIQGGSRIILYIDTNKHIQELSQLPQENWVGADLTQLTASPLVDDAGLLGYTWSVHGSQQVAFVDATHHVEELSYIANGIWRKVNW